MLVSNKNINFLVVEFIILIEWLNINMTAFLVPEAEISNSPYNTENINISLIVNQQVTIENQKDITDILHHLHNSINDIIVHHQYHHQDLVILVQVQNQSHHQLNVGIVFLIINIKKEKN